VLRAALTGGIACGKSVVACVLRDKGCFIHSADEAAHDLMSPGRPAWKEIVARFGQEILQPDGAIDRIRLGRTVFSDLGARLFLNKLLHPLVLAEEKRLIAGLERDGRTAIFISEAALTIEAGYSRFYDKIIVVHCPEDVQVRRLMEREGITEEEARRRIRVQMPGEEKRRHADYVIDASGSVLETIEQAERVYAALLQDAELKALSAKKLTTRVRRPHK
jgi:dephospho-CoA kinase